MTLFRTLEAVALTVLLALVIDSWRRIVSTQDDVNALTAQVEKVYTEVTAARDELLAQIAELEAQGVDVTSLKDAVQRLDDLNADAEAPVDPETPENPLPDQGGTDASGIL